LKPSSGQITMTFGPRATSSPRCRVWSVTLVRSAGSAASAAEHGQHDHEGGHAVRVRTPRKTTTPPAACACGCSGGRCAIAQPASRRCVCCDGRRWQRRHAQLPLQALHEAKTNIRGAAKNQHAQQTHESNDAAATSAGAQTHLSSTPWCRPAQG
jgi:hypothetical protein